MKIITNIVGQLDKFNEVVSSKSNEIFFFSGYSKYKDLIASLFKKKQICLDFFFCGKEIKVNGKKKLGFSTKFSTLSSTKFTNWDFNFIFYL